MEFFVSPSSTTTCSLYRPSLARATPYAFLVAIWFHRKKQINTDRCGVAFFYCGQSVPLSSILGSFWHISTVAEQKIWTLFSLRSEHRMSHLVSRFVAGGTRHANVTEANWWCVFAWSSRIQTLVAADNAALQLFDHHLRHVFGQRLSVPIHLILGRWKTPTSSGTREDLKRCFTENRKKCCWKFDHKPLKQNWYW